MSDYAIAGTFVIFLAFGLLIPHIVQRRRARRRLRASLLDNLRTSLRLATADAMRWEGLYRDKCAEYTALANVADAETVRRAGQAMAQNPLFYITAAWTEVDDWRLAEWRGDAS